MSLETAAQSRIARCVFDVDAPIVHRHVLGGLRKSSGRQRSSQRCDSTLLRRHSVLMGFLLPVKPFLIPEGSDRHRG
jgi:hypothetical protein